MLKPGAGTLTLLLGALIAIAPLTMDIYLASMPSMAQSLSATPDQVQLTLSIYMYAWGCAQLAAGPLSDRLGRRPALLWGLGIFVVASVVCALSQNVWTLIGGRLVQGLMLAPDRDRAARDRPRSLHGGESCAPSVADGDDAGHRADRRADHPLAVVAPMFAFMVALMMTMPGAVAAALTPFPDIAGSASSLMFFVQLAVASTAALIVGLTFDGSARPMALTIAVAALGTFLSFRLAKRVRTAPG